MFSYNYEMPAGCSTIVVLNGKDEVLLCKRSENTDAFPEYWCLPGGFLDIHKENLYQCALRELREETNIVPDYLDLVTVLSDPGTDPRYHMINAIYLVDSGFLPHQNPFKDMRPGDDIVELRWFSLEEVKDMELAFNHRDILKKVCDEVGLSHEL